MPNQENYYTLDEFAKLINVSKITLRRWDNNGKLVAHRTNGNARFYTRQDYLDFLKMKNFPKRMSAGYIRTQSRAQMFQIDTYKLRMADWAKEHNLEISNFYVDNGFSGLDFTRPAFYKLMKDCASGQIDCIIIPSWETLSPNGFRQLCQFLNDVYTIKVFAINDNIMDAYKYSPKDIVADLSFMIDILMRRIGENESIEFLTKVRDYLDHKYLSMC